MRYKVEWKKRSGVIVVTADTPEAALTKARGLYIRVPKNQEEFPGEYDDIPFVLPVHEVDDDFTKIVTEVDIADNNFNIDPLSDDVIVPLTALLEVL